jgi:uncharacterized SAM-binding protein YcdF (DUF218 family)
MRFLATLLTVLTGVLGTSAMFLWFAAGEIYDYSDTFELERDAGRVDVVVVLAGGKGRIPQAVTLWKEIRDRKGKGQEPVLFLSGLGPGNGIETFSGQGVPDSLIRMLNRDNVVFENVSENTLENAQIFASFARQKRWKSVVLVTAGYHMRRAEFILRKVLDTEIELRTETVDARPFGRNEWHRDEYAVRVTVFEYLKWLYYRYSY